MAESILLAELVIWPYWHLEHTDQYSPTTPEVRIYTEYVIQLPDEEASKCFNCKCTHFYARTHKNSVVSCPLLIEISTTNWCKITRRLHKQSPDRRPSGLNVWLTDECIKASLYCVCAVDLKQKVTLEYWKSRVNTMEAENLLTSSHKTCYNMQKIYIWYVIWKKKDTEAKRKQKKSSDTAQTIKSNI